MEQPAESAPSIADVITAVRAMHSDLSGRIDGLSDRVALVEAATRRTHAEVAGVRADVAQVRADVAGVKADTAFIESWAGDLQEAVRRHVRDPRAHGRDAA